MKLEPDLKKARELISWADHLVFVYRLFFGAPEHKMFKKGILKFCGIKPVKFTDFAPIVNSTEEKRKKLLKNNKNLLG